MLSTSGTSGLALVEHVPRLPNDPSTACPFNRKPYFSIKTHIIYYILYYGLYCWMIVPWVHCFFFSLVDQRLGFENCTVRVREQQYCWTTVAGGINYNINTHCLSHECIVFGFSSAGSKKRWWKEKLYDLLNMVAGKMAINFIWKMYQNDERTNKARAKCASAFLQQYIVMQYSIITRHIQFKY